MTTSIEMPAPDSVEAEGQKSPALDSLDVEGYKSICSAKIDLGSINVLIGANGSGKSNLVSLFGLLADLADRRLQLHIARQGGADALLHFGRKKTSALRILLRLGLHEYRAVLVPSAGDTLVFDHETASSRAPSPFEIPGRLPGQLMGEFMGPPGSKETGLGAGEQVFGSKSFITEPLASAMRSWRPFHFHDTGRSAPAKQKTQDR